jgi:tellurite resistance protein TehA-like permease
MDRHTLFLLIVGGLIYAFINEIVAFGRRFATRDTTKQKVKGVFTKTNLLWAFYLACFAATVLGFIRDLRATGPVTRMDVLWIVTDVLAVCLWILLFLGWMVTVAVERRWRKRAEALQNHENRVSDRP